MRQRSPKTANLRPGAKSKMEALYGRIKHYHLQSNLRMKDEELKCFLAHVRKEQPTKSYIQELFEGRTIGGSLKEAVKETLVEGQRAEVR